MKYKLTAIFMTIMIFCGNCYTLKAEELSENTQEPIIEEYVGQPKYAYDEGAFNNVYYNVSMQASGSRCWLKLQYGTSAQLRTEMTVYVGTFLGSWNTTILRIGNGYTDEVFSDWSDGATYIAAGVTGIAKISGTQVSYLELSTYSS